MTEVFSGYFKWHYGRSFLEFFKIVKNFLAFLVHFFSFKLLLKSLFHPWHRMREDYPKSDLGAFFESLLVNVLMRIVGFVSRIIIIFIGILTLFASLALSILMVMVWVFLPFIALGCIIAGVSIILKTI